MTPEQHDEDSLEKAQDALLHIHLNEYRKLKDEQITRIVMREHLVYVTLGVLGGVSSYALHADHHYAFLVIPWACVILGWLYIMTDEKISAIGRYLRINMTEKLAALAETEAESLLGWEIAHLSDKHRFPRKLLQLLIDQITFVFSGVFALVAFWWLQADFNMLFKVTWGIEAFLLLLLGIWIFITADLKVGK